MDEEQHPGQLLVDPLLIIAAPRSGSSLLFSLLSSHRDLWSLNREDRLILEGPFHPRERGWSSSVLTAEDLDESTSERLRRAYFAAAGNLELVPLGGRFPVRGRGRARIPDWIERLSRRRKRPPIRLVEKDTRSLLRVPFMLKLFPGARLIYLTRDPRGNIASMYRGWQDGERYRDYSLPVGFEIADHQDEYWSFLLPPEWRTMSGRRLVEICAFQWRVIHEYGLRDIAQLPPDSLKMVRYEDLIREPVRILRDIAGWGRLDPRPFDRFADRLPRIQSRTRPDRDKWRSLQQELDRVIPSVSEIASRLGYEIEPGPEGADGNLG